jgi:HAE1 family hydrophobic/amphiphilic exporter-1
VAAWEKTRKPHEKGTAPTVTFEDASKDLNDAIRQLGTAVGLSILLIFLVLLLQFGSVMEPLLVLVSVPLGFIGVLVSLFVFRSTLSLNSILGVILLNGIAVANSIILVDFIKRLVEDGKTPREAAVDAARKRLRPILITSMTTVLGMLPIALGTGEGGRILQPLGIAVSGGLWVSMGLTLFLVPAMQVSYLEWRQSRPARVTVLSTSWRFKLKLLWRRFRRGEELLQGSLPERSG